MLYLVRTQPTKEDKVVQGIVERVKRFNFPIHSVAFTGSRGFVYIEAESEPDVKEALFDVRYTRGLVRGDTHTEELVESKSVNLAELFKAGTTVQFISGPFKGDRARVVSLNVKKGELIVINLGSEIEIRTKVSVDDVVKVSE